MSGNFRRRIGARPCVDDFVSIDIQEWLRIGKLNGQTHFIRPSMNLQLEIETGHAGLDVRVRSDLLRPRDQHLAIRWTMPMPGVRRIWLICPNPCCQRPCQSLYFQAGFFCRLCLGLRYRSQSRSTYQRRCAEYGALEAGLPLFDGDAVRPKGMHEKTFQPLAERAQALYRYIAGPAIRAQQRVRELDRMSEAEFEAECRRVKAAKRKRRCAMKSPAPLVETHGT